MIKIALLMLVLKSNSFDPHFNLATEEYLLRNFEDDFFMIWRSQPSVILGKHQNLHEEVNIDFARENKIEVARRISGGGTVYHDLNNINFTFIKNGGKDKLVDFYKHTSPIIDTLAKLGVKADFEGKNDLRINGLKISGNAEHIYKDKVLHHGTLLFKSDLSKLTSVLKKSADEYKSKSVKSIRSKVTNISSHLKEQIKTEDFLQYIFQSIKEYYHNPKIYELNSKDIIDIEKLVQEKFSSWEWIFGYSPKYTFEKTIIINKNQIDIKIETANAIISAAHISLDNKLLDYTNKILFGVKHDPEFIFEAIDQNFSEICNEFPKITANELTKLLY